jgi:hypothetical protein
MIPVSLIDGRTAIIHDVHLHKLLKLLTTLDRAGTARIELYAFVDGSMTRIRAHAVEAILEANPVFPDERDTDPAPSP